MSEVTPLHRYLPQSGSMLLIDDPFTTGTGWVNASVRIAEDSLFFKPGVGVPAWVGLEYMAQTVALYAGVIAVEEGESVRIGFLLGTRRFTAHLSNFRLGCILNISATEIWQDGQMAVYDCKIENQSGHILAEAALNVFQPTDPLVFLENSKNE